MLKPDSWGRAGAFLSAPRWPPLLPTMYSCSDFLAAPVLGLCAPLPRRTTSVQNLMYVKEDIILPHTVTFYDLIINKAQARGTHGGPARASPHAGLDGASRCIGPARRRLPGTLPLIMHCPDRRCGTSRCAATTLGAGQVGAALPV